MSDFFKTHFDKLLLSTLFLATFGVFIHFQRELIFYVDPSKAQHLLSTVNWLENTIGQILAALLTLLVGRGLQRSGDGRPGNGNSTAVAPAPPELPTSANAPAIASPGLASPAPPQVTIK